MDTPSRPIRVLLSLFFFLLAAVHAVADEFLMRVVDVGQGECVSVKVTDRDGPRCIRGVWAPSISSIFTGSETIRDSMAESSNQHWEVGAMNGKVRRRYHVGGMLSYYCRDVARSF